MVQVTILHITTHMGGGVGRVLSNIAAYANRNGNKYIHKILILEQPEKTQFLDVCRQNGIDVFFTPDIKTIEVEMAKADIIQISWWHHPKMAKLLNDFPQIRIRLIVWSHISGCNYPAIPFEFVKKPHKTFFTTRYTLDNPYWDEEQQKYVCGNAEVVFGAGDLKANTKVKPTEHTGFNVGYVGTLSYSKLSPDFVSYCSIVDIPDVKFIMVGDRDNQASIEKEFVKYGISNRIEFTGYTNNVNKELARFDVFGYPLNPWHFGTTENTLLEAMASGVPVVALNQCTEKYIIKHMETGLLADNKEHYAQLIRYLYENPDERKRIGKNARDYVLQEFSMEKNVQRINNAYDEVMNMPARVFEFSSVFGDKPYQWFLSCLGKDRQPFEDSIDIDIMADDKRKLEIETIIKNCRYILKEKSKGSINHFGRYFPYDRNIMYWKSLIDEGRDNC